LDDLPRTLRREREARQREAAGRPPAYLMRDKPYADSPPTDEPMPAAVVRFDVPFVHLAAFFLKAVIAAIPALILLGVLLWLAGDLLQTFFPALVKMQILIRFPNG
jgi:hypothetical protein